MLSTATREGQSNGLQAVETRNIHTLQMSDPKQAYQMHMMYIYNMYIYIYIYLYIICIYIHIYIYIHIVRCDSLRPRFDISYVVTVFGVFFDQPFKLFQTEMTAMNLWMVFLLPSSFDRFGGRLFSYLLGFVGFLGQASQITAMKVTQKNLPSSATVSMESMTVVRGRNFHHPRYHENPCAATSFWITACNHDGGRVERVEFLNGIREIIIQITNGYTCNQLSWVASPRMWGSFSGLWKNHSLKVFLNSFSITNVQETSSW